MSTVDAEPKKKRRQNVACDACKLRRVKCDLSDLLESPTVSAPSTSTSTQPSLQDLVRANPHVGCSNCKNKGVTCSTEQILHPARPNKGGKRIEEAKKRFGDGQAGTMNLQEARDGVAMLGDDWRPAELGSGVDSDAWQGKGSGMGVDPGGGLEPGMDFDWTALMGTDFDPALLEATRLPTQPMDGLLSNSQFFNHAPLPPVPPWAVMTNTFPSVKPFADPPPFIDDTPNITLPSVPALSSSTPPANSSQNVTFSQHSNSARLEPGDLHAVWRNRLQGQDREAAPMWDQLHLNSQSPLPSASPALIESNKVGPKFSSPYPSTISEHLAAPGAPVMPEMEFDAGLMSFVPRNASPSPQILKPPQSKDPSSWSIFRPNEARSRPVSLYLDAGSSNLVPGRKRSRDGGSPTPDEEDPWRLWSDPDRQVVRWSRREAVQQQLADKALGGELSRHLVKTFFHCVHPSFPALSPEGFYLEWERAGQRSDRLGPAQETLCAVMEAWGARYSDSPVVLGLDLSKRTTGPKVIQPDGTLAPGTQARAHWGRSRLSVCNALVDRARKLIDQYGLMRQPSVTGLQALLLYNQLLNLTDQRHLAASQYMENLMIHSAIIEQTRVLQLMWDSTGEIPSNQEELPLTNVQMRMKQRRIFWTVLVSDAFNAVTSGELPKIPDEELDSVGRWLNEVEAKLPLSTFKTLAFFVSCYHRIALGARFATRKITHPNRRPGAVDVETFCKSVRECWVQTKSIARDITVISAELLQSCEHTLIGFSPVNYITNLRLSCPYLLLILHQAVRTQLDFRKNLKESFIYDDSPRSNWAQGSVHSNSPPGSEATNVVLLEELHVQSVDVLLDSCRSQINMYKTLLPTGMVQTAAVFLRVLIATAQFLAEVPTVEQAYSPNTLGGYGWTWETKQKEVQVCIEALYQLGWAWADVSEALDSVMLAMERMTPSNDQLEQYILLKTEADDRIVLASRIAGSNDQRLLERAMSFWPPQSVPSILENAMKDLKIGDGLDFTSQAVPLTELKQINEALSQSETAPSSEADGQSIIAQGLMSNLAQMGQTSQDLATAAKMPCRPADSIRPSSSRGLPGFFETGSYLDGGHSSLCSSINAVSQSWQPAEAGHRGDPADAEPVTRDERPAKRQMFESHTQSVTFSDMNFGIPGHNPSLDPNATEASSSRWTSSPGNTIGATSGEDLDQNWIGQWLDLHSPTGGGTGTLFEDT